MADWELWLTATTQHHESCILLHIASLRKDQTTKFEVRFPLNVRCVCFHAIVKSKNYTIIKLGTIFMYLSSLPPTSSLDTSLVLYSSVKQCFWLLILASPTVRIFSLLQPFHSTSYPSFMSQISYRPLPTPSLHMFYEKISYIWIRKASCKM